MTKAELIAELAKQTDMTKADTERVINAFLDTAKKTLRKEGRLPLAGFGTFVVTRRKAREGRNPQTGAPIRIKATKGVRFKPSKDLKEKL